MRKLSGKKRSFRDNIGGASQDKVRMGVYSIVSKDMSGMLSAMLCQSSMLTLYAL